MESLSGKGGRHCAPQPNFNQQLKGCVAGNTLDLTTVEDFRVSVQCLSKSYDWMDHFSPVVGHEW